MKKTLTTVLLFAGMASAWASGLPDGNYKASCKDIKMVGASLHATCQTERGNPIYTIRMLVGSPLPWLDTTLDNVSTCADVENRDGQLFCAQPK